MKRKQLKAASEEVLLKLFECSTQHPSDTWSYESAFRALDRTDYQECGISILTVLRNRGWVRSEEFDTPRLTQNGETFRVLDGLSVTLTERGKEAAFHILRKRESRSFGERLSEANWVMWGGLAATVAAVASIAAAVFSFMSLGHS